MYWVTCAYTFGNTYQHVWPHVQYYLCNSGVIMCLDTCPYTCELIGHHMWWNTRAIRHVQIMCNRVHNHMCIRMWTHMSAHVTACAIAQIQCKRNHVGALFRRGAGAWPPPPPGPLTLSTANHIRKTRDHTCTRMCLHVLSHLWITCAHAWLSPVWAHVKHAFTWHIHTRTDTGMKCNHTLTPF